MVTRINARNATRSASRKVAQAVGPAALEAGKRVRQAARVVQDNVSHAVSGTLGLSGERMSKVDTAWLRMDSPSNLMMIVGVWTLRPRVGMRRVRTSLKRGGAGQAVAATTPSGTAITRPRTTGMSASRRWISVSVHAVPRWFSR